MLARELGRVLELPVIELDQLFWKPGPTPTPPDQWRALLATVIKQKTWIMDGDLGDYDEVGLPLRLRAADGVILLDFPRRIYMWRALRRSRETWEFWKWAWAYPRTHRPRVLAAIETHAKSANVQILTGPAAVQRFLSTMIQAEPSPAGPV